MNQLYKAEQLELRFRLVMLELVQLFEKKNKTKYGRKIYKLLIKVNKMIINNIKKKIQLLHIR